MPGMSPDRVAIISINNPLFEFETILDDTCNRLQHKQTQYSIRRLRELNSVLINLERELESLSQETSEK